MTLPAPYPSQRAMKYGSADADVGQRRQRHERLRKFDRKNASVQQQPKREHHRQHQEKHEPFAAPEPQMPAPGTAQAAAQTSKVIRWLRSNARRWPARQPVYSNSLMLNFDANSRTDLSEEFDRPRFLRALVRRRLHRGRHPDD